ELAALLFSARTIRNATRRPPGLADGCQPVTFTPFRHSLVSNSHLVEADYTPRRIPSVFSWDMVRTRAPDRCGARPKRLRVLRLRQELPDGGLQPGRGGDQSYRVLDTQRRTVHRTGQPRPLYRAQCQRAASASVVS